MVELLQSPHIVPIYQYARKHPVQTRDGISVFFSNRYPIFMLQPISDISENFQYPTFQKKTIYLPIYRHVRYVTLVQTGLSFQRK